MSAAVLERVTFSTPRAAEFFEIRALQAQTGRPSGQFGDVVIKELADNALDAAETARVAPELEISARTVGDVQYVTVADNGPGMAPELIGRILDYSVLVSDKSAYRSPTRGLQGNAWKTIVGIPPALGVGEPIVIESRGLRHEVSGWLDPARNVVIRHPEPSPSPRMAGTSVTVPLPADVEVNARSWAARFAAVNPHAAVFYRADCADSEITDSYKPQVSEGWHKPVPSDPLVPAWYDADAFRRLVFSHVGVARNGGRDLPLGEFIRSFDGLSGSAKARQIRALLPGIETLGDFERHPDQVSALLYAMQSTARAPKPTALGHVPEEHYRDWQDNQYTVVRHWFRRSRIADTHGRPWVIEVAIAETAAAGDLVYAVNYSPSFGDPLGETRLVTAAVQAYGAASFLTRCDAAPDYDNDHKRAAIVHVITPAAEFTDKGKVRLDIPADVAEAFAACLGQAASVLHREDRQREKNLRAGRRQAAAAERRAKAESAPPREPTLIEAVAMTIEAAIEAQREGTDLPFSARSLYYKIRPLVQDVTSAELTDVYFTQQLLPAWQREHQPISGLYYEARGTLYHPHDPGGAEDVPLGTREVQSYVPPRWSYDKVLVVEKAGLWPLLRASGIADRYDMAIITSEGFSTTGCRLLLGSLPAGTVRIFSLHDADPAGYNLSAVLGDETRRMPGHHADVTDIGLTVADAIALGLPSEEFTRTTRLPQRIAETLTEDEAAWFGGIPAGRTSKGKTRFTCKRVELNAFSSPGLIAYIEGALDRHGATGKVVPPDGDIRFRAAEAHRYQVETRVREIIAELVDTEAIARALVSESAAGVDLDIGADLVRAELERHRPLSWRAAVSAEVAKRLEASPVDLRQRVAELLAAQEGKAR